MTLGEIIDFEALAKALDSFVSAKPFRHCVVDGFFTADVADTLASEFPAYEDETCWHSYNNAIEVKRVSNNWNRFPEVTYKVLEFLNSQSFIRYVADRVPEMPELFSDPGLNGGGWHIHARGGRLNPHLDYSIHPKLGLQRKLNLIVYLNTEWDEAWGGCLGLWGNESGAAPGELQKQVIPHFNRAVLFDTTMNSWHGLSKPLTCPEGHYRKSLAVYYLAVPRGEVDTRGKALFAPDETQMDDPSVLELIKKRSSVGTAHEVYSSHKMDGA